MSDVDIETALCEMYLADLGYCDTWTPPDLEERLADGPVHRIARVGGPSDSHSGDDFPTVSIDTFALRTVVAPRAAHDAAKAVHDRMVAIAGVSVPSGLLDTCECTSGPVGMPWPAPQVAVVRQIFRVTTR